MRPLLYEALHDLAYLEHVRFGGLQEDLDIRQDGSDRFKVRAVAPQ